MGVLYCDSYRMTCFCNLVSFFLIKTSCRKNPVLPEMTPLMISLPSPLEEKNVKHVKSEGSLSFPCWNVFAITKCKVSVENQLQIWVRCRFVIWVCVTLHVCVCCMFPGCIVGTPDADSLWGATVLFQRENVSSHTYTVHTHTYTYCLYWNTYKRV